MDRRRDPDAVLGRAGARLLGRERRDVDLDEVRFDRIGVDGQPRLRQAERQPLRARVVVREPLDVVVERVDAAAATIPAWRIAPPKRCLTGGRSPSPRLAGEDRAERAAETFREAERDRVEAAADLGRRDPDARPRRSAAAPRRDGRRGRARARRHGCRRSPRAARSARPTGCACSRPRRLASAASGSSGLRYGGSTCSAVKRPATPGSPA